MVVWERVQTRGAASRLENAGYRSAESKPLPAAGLAVKMVGVVLKILEVFVGGVATCPKRGAVGVSR